MQYRLVGNNLDIIRYNSSGTSGGAKRCAASLVKTAFDYALENQLKPLTIAVRTVAWLKRHQGICKITSLKADDYPLIVTPSKWASSSACRRYAAPANSQPVMGLIRMPDMSQLPKSVPFKGSTVNSASFRLHIRPPYRQTGMAFQRTTFQVALVEATYFSLLMVPELIYSALQLLNNMIVTIPLKFADTVYNR